MALENTGAGAYTYATQFLVSVPKVLVASAAIALVEGRHAGFLNVLTRRPILTDPTPGQNDHNDPTGSTYPTLSTGLPDYSQEVPQPLSLVAQRGSVPCESQPQRRSWRTLGRFFQPGSGGSVRGAQLRAVAGV